LKIYAGIDCIILYHVAIDLLIIYLLEIELSKKLIKTKIKNSKIIELNARIKGVFSYTKFTSKIKTEETKKKAFKLAIKNKLFFLIFIFQIIMRQVGNKNKRVKVSSIKIKWLNKRKLIQ